MGHPVFLYRTRLIAYIFIWIVVAIPQAMFTISFFKADNMLAWTDGLVSSIWFGLLALTIWYNVSYSSFERGKIEITLLNHFVSSIVTILIWLGLCFYSINLLPFFQGFEELFKETFWWRFFDGVLMYIVVLLVFYLINYFQDKQESVEREAWLKTTKKEAELNALKSQINPHFLFNSLNSVNALIRMEPEKATDMVLKLSDYLRYSIKKDIKEKTTFKEELENLLRYIEIEKIRFEERLCFENKIDNKCEHLLVPNMILQPIIENAVKHGTSTSGRPEKIQIMSHCEDNVLIVEIENTYDSQAYTRRGEGLGMRNIRERMNLIYNRNDLFHFKKSNDTFTVSLKFPQYDHN